MLFSALEIYDSQIHIIPKGVSRDAPSSRRSDHPEYYLFMCQRRSFTLHEHPVSKYSGQTPTEFVYRIIYGIFHFIQQLWRLVDHQNLTKDIHCGTVNKNTAVWKIHPESRCISCWKQGGKRNHCPILAVLHGIFETYFPPSNFPNFYSLKPLFYLVSTTRRTLSIPPPKGIVKTSGLGNAPASIAGLACAVLQEIGGFNQDMGRKIDSTPQGCWFGSFTDSLKLTAKATWKFIDGWKMMMKFPFEQQKPPESWWLVQDDDVFFSPFGGAFKLPIFKVWNIFAVRFGGTEECVGTGVSTQHPIEFCWKDISPRS